MSDAELSRQLAVIAQELQHIRADIAALRGDVEAISKEGRSERLLLRGDLTLMTARQNTAIEDNKKKLPVSLPGYSSSLPLLIGSGVANTSFKRIPVA